MQKWVWLLLRSIAVPLPNCLLHSCIVTTSTMATAQMGSYQKPHLAGILKKPFCNQEAHLTPAYPPCIFPRHSLHALRCFSSPPPKSTMPDIKEAQWDMKGPMQPHDKVTYARNAYLSPHVMSDKQPNLSQTRVF